MTEWFTKEKYFATLTRIVQELERSWPSTCTIKCPDLRMLNNYEYFNYGTMLSLYYYDNLCYTITINDKNIIKIEYFSRDLIKIWSYCHNCLKCGKKEAIQGKDFCKTCEIRILKSAAVKFEPKKALTRKISWAK